MVSISVEAENRRSPYRPEICFPRNNQRRSRETMTPHPPETYRDAVIRMQDERAEVYGGV